MSSAYDQLISAPLLYGGRIDRSAFVISIAVLLVLCWISAIVRFYVRIFVQRALSIDDGFLVMGLFTLTASVGLVYSQINIMYVQESFLLGQITLAFMPGFAEANFDFQKMLVIVLILSWVSICCIKLSFLFLFRRLIDRIEYMVVYWWIVMVYVLATSGYGLAVYVLICPYFYSFEALKCTMEPGLTRAVNFAVSQITLDIVGDIMILVIPIHLIWKIRIGMRQKFWLATSLCLTIVIIVTTIVRGSGIRTAGGQVDGTWEYYWNIVSAEVGVIMTSATAFRALYMSNSSSSSDGRHQPAPQRSSEGWISILLRSSKRFVTRTYKSLTTRSSSKVTDTYESAPDSEYSNEKREYHLEMGTLPRAHMTGIRTLFRDTGRTRTSRDMNGLMESHWEEENDPHAMQIARESLEHQQQQNLGYAIYYPNRHTNDAPRREGFI